MEPLCTVAENIGAIVENSSLVSLKVKYRIAIGSSNSNFGNISKSTESRDSKRYLYIHDHSSIIHKSQNVEEIQESINRQIDKVWYTTAVVYYSVLKMNETLYILQNG